MHAVEHHTPSTHTAINIQRDQHTCSRRTAQMEHPLLSSVYIDAVVLLLLRCWICACAYLLLLLLPLSASHDQTHLLMVLLLALLVLLLLMVAMMLLLPMTTAPALQTASLADCHEEP